MINIALIETIVQEVLGIAEGYVRNQSIRTGMDFIRSLLSAAQSSPATAPDAVTIDQVNGHLDSLGGSIVPVAPASVQDDLSAETPDAVPADAQTPAACN